MNIFCYLYDKLRAFFKAIGVFLGFSLPDENDVQWQDGYLTVVGKDCIEILLDKNPEIVDVEFVDEASTGSCDPHQDMVDYTITNDENCNFYLKVKWDVSTVRKVYWRVEY